MTKINPNELTEDQLENIRKESYLEMVNRKKGMRKRRKHRRNDNRVEINAKHEGFTRPHRRW